MKIPASIKCFADKGYQDIHVLYPNSHAPKEKPRGAELTAEDKAANWNLAQRRVVCEHINCSLKTFRLLSERYKNRRQRFGLRFNLIASFYNYDLVLAY